MQSFQILVVEDFRPFRQFACSLLRERAEFQVAEASDGLEAVRKAEQLQPDLILLEVSLPNLNGIEVSKRMCKVAPAAKILFLSLESSPDVVQEALSIGAQGYVHKLYAQSDLMPAIDAVLKGKRFVSEALTSEGRQSRDLGATAD
jgi:DNA-binding NarL/FixJ family response regulator